VLATLAMAAWILWRCFNAEPGRVGLEFPFDLIFYYFPMLEQAAERLRGGELPLWNPYQCCGVPFLATAQAAVFYPPTWLVVFLPVGLAIQTLMFGQVLAAGAFACLFFRSLGKSLFACTLGGVMFMFGCVLGQIYWPSEVSTIVWLPFLMWCVERFVQSGRWTWWALFTLGVTLQALAGFPQFMVYTFYLLVPYAMLRMLTSEWAKPRAARDWRTEVWGKCAALAGGCAIAACLAAVQLVPTYELARNTARGDRLDEKAVHYLEAERGKYFTLPGLLSNMLDPRAKMITFDFPDGSGYLGMAAPLMVGLGLLLGWRDSRTWFFLAAAVVSCVLAFGYYGYFGGLFRLYAKLPTGNMFRTPSRLLLLTYFSLITLAVFGMDGLRDGLRELRGKMHLRILLAVMAVVLLAVVKSIGDADPTVGGDAVRLAAAFVLLVVAMYLVAEHRVALRIMQACFAALLLFDLANAIAPYGSLRDIPVEWGQRPHWAGVSPVDPDELARVTSEAGLGRVALPGLRPTKLIEPPDRFYMVTEYEPLLPQRWFWANRTMGGEHGFVMCQIDPDKYRGFYDMAGVTHMFRTNISELAKKRLGPRQWEIHRRVPASAPAGMESRVERRDGALPRAYLVSRYEVCSPADALQRFVAADFDYEHGVLLEEEPGLVMDDAGAPRELAEIVSYTPERAVIRTQAPGPRLLVLSDTHFPGWTARVDGVEAKILRANYLFRAVAVPAGTHEVVFEYRPSSFRTGLGISAAGWIVFLAVITAAWWRERRKRQSRSARSASPAVS